MFDSCFSAFAVICKVDEHVRKTIERLRTQRAFRQQLGGAQNVGSDTDVSVMDVQNMVNSQIQSGARLAPVNLVILHPHYHSTST